MYRTCLTFNIKLNPGLANCEFKTGLTGKNHAHFLNPKTTPCRRKVTFHLRGENKKKKNC